jgi:hypothetical protein
MALLLNLAPSGNEGILVIVVLLRSVTQACSYPRRIFAAQLQCEHERLVKRLEIRFKAETLASQRGWLEVLVWARAGVAPRVELELPVKVWAMARMSPARRCCPNAGSL